MRERLLSNWKTRQLAGSKSSDLIADTRRYTPPSPVVSYGFSGYAGGRRRVQTDAGDIPGPFGRYPVMRRRGAPGRAPSFRRRPLGGEQVDNADRTAARIPRTERGKYSAQPNAARREERSRLMAGVRQHGTSPELVVRKIVRNAGL